MPERVRIARIRTMLVDDDAPFRLLLRAELEGSGRFEVVAEAGDGVDALRQAGALRLDLILLDLDMPVLDGMAALPRLVALGRATRVVVLSMRETPGLAADVQRLGGDDCVHKALQGEALVQRLLARPLAPGAAEAPAPTMPRPTA